MDTKVRLTSYQLESSVRTKQYASTERILGQYKALLDEQYKIYQEKNDLLSIKREYWLLYSFYTSFYLSQGDLENASVRWIKPLLMRIVIGLREIMRSIPTWRLRPVIIRRQETFRWRFIV